MMRYRCSACRGVSFFDALNIPAMFECTRCNRNMCLQCGPPAGSLLCKECERESAKSGTSLLSKARVFVKKRATGAPRQ